jgi:hypothetical protein
VTAAHERRGALEAVDRIVNRGGAPKEVLHDVALVLFQLYSYVAVDLETGRGPALGEQPGNAERYPVEFGGERLGDLVVAWPDESDDAFLARVATLIWPYCRAAGRATTA